METTNNPKVRIDFTVKLYFESSSQCPRPVAWLENYWMSEGCGF